MPRTFIPSREWQDARHRVGLQGELEAMAWLIASGWQVEAHRFKLGRHDVDLVIRRDHTVAFVEVKTRNSTSFGAGVEAVRWRKQRLIARVAALWVLRHGRAGDQYRFDVVDVRRAGTGWELEHYPDAFRPPESLI
jgi:putative endonuclease